MIDTEVDTQTEAALDEDEANARVPWESIDPDEHPADYVSPFASASTIAAEAKEASAAPLSPLLLNEFSVLENETAAAVSPEEREEQLADRAFFSDEKISIETMIPAPEIAGIVSAGLDLSSVPIVDPFSYDVPAQKPLQDRRGTGGPPVFSEKEHGPAAHATASEAPVRDMGVPPMPVAGAVEDLATPTTKGDDAAGTGETPVSRAEIPVAAPVPQGADATPWDTIDQTPAAPLHPSEVDVALSPAAHDRFAPTGAGEKSPVVSRTIPADAVQENVVTFSSTESLQSAASELAALSESFGPAIEVEQAASQTILVTVSEGDHLSGLMDVQPQLAVQPQASAESEVQLDEEIGAPVSSTGGGWTIPLMCMGLGLIACCMVIPQGEANRQLRYQQVALAADLQNVQKQVAVNDEFLKKVSDDPTLAERLAGRQMKTIRKGQTVIDLKQTSADDDMSPFSLVAIAKPADLPPYKPRTGTIANLCNNARSRLYLLGAALGMVAVGLVMGFGGTSRKVGHSE
ncbi:MAG TPA: hypothetical protein VFE47_14045 [Tepidisphaeraceae bacterium]|jgi:hypothetical protein|nr:hypothetical protein [Tepidisphaeraceae bacterium]